MKRTLVRIYAVSSRLTSSFSVCILGDHHGISQPTVSRIIKRVVNALATHRDRFIFFPEGNEVAAVKEDFFNIAACPNIIGAIDGTHVKIKCPGGDNAVQFINRKGFYSLNVQVTVTTAFSWLAWHILHMLSFKISYRWLLMLNYVSEISSHDGEVVPKMQECGTSAD